MKDKTKRFLADGGERAFKTFWQFYFGLWTLRVGLFDTGVAEGHVAAFDLLFTWDNVKAGVVGVALSFASSLASKRAGADDSASLLPANVDPPQ